MSFFNYFTDAVAYLDAGDTAEGIASIYGGTTAGYGGTAGGRSVEGGIAPTPIDDQIPDYSFVRGRVPVDYDEDRRPGSRGRRYFTDYGYVPSGTQGNYASAVQAQAAALAAANQANMAPNATFTPSNTQQQSLVQTGTPASQVASMLPVPQQGGLENFSPQYRRGGIASLAQGRYLSGATDGMADKVPARIDNTQEARLSDGEFVVPADVVSHLGNGNSNAGAKQLYGMMNRVRKARTGRTTQGKEINPKTFMPNQG